MKTMMNKLVSIVAFGLSLGASNSALALMTDGQCESYCRQRGTDNYYMSQKLWGSQETRAYGAMSDYSTKNYCRQDSGGAFMQNVIAGHVSWEGPTYSNGGYGTLRCCYCYARTGSGSYNFGH